MLQFELFPNRGRNYCAGGGATEHWAEAAPRCGVRLRPWACSSSCSTPPLERFPYRILALRRRSRLRWMARLFFARPDFTPSARMRELPRSARQNLSSGATIAVAACPCKLDWRCRRLLRCLSPQRTPWCRNCVLAQRVPCKPRPFHPSAIAALPVRFSSARPSSGATAAAPGREANASFASAGPCELASLCPTMDGEAEALRSQPPRRRVQYPEQRPCSGPPQISSWKARRAKRLSL